MERRRGGAGVEALAGRRALSAAACARGEKDRGAAPRPRPPARGPEPGTASVWLWGARAHRAAEEHEADKEGERHDAIPAAAADSGARVALAGREGSCEAQAA